MQYSRSVIATGPRHPQPAGPIISKKLLNPWHQQQWINHNIEMANVARSVGRYETQ